MHAIIQATVLDIKGVTKMLTRYKPFQKGMLVEDAAKDFAEGRYIDLYRVGKKALYIPRTVFGWSYIPRESLKGAVYQDSTCTSYS